MLDDAAQQTNKQNQQTHFKNAKTIPTSSKTTVSVVMWLLWWWWQYIVRGRRFNPWLDCDVTFETDRAVENPIIILATLGTPGCD